TPTATPTATPTPRPTATPTPTPVPGAKATTTTLSVIQVPLPFGLGGFAIPIANVGPGSPAGTVQFKDGNTKLGGPVPVFGGIAVGPFVTLPAGHHSVTAVFTPTDTAKFKPSTSNTVNFTF
ncbi:MAG: Ig-like domain-containing protein, partial [Pseudonocardiaceae bacterium]